MESERTSANIIFAKYFRHVFVFPPGIFLLDGVCLVCSDPMPPTQHPQRVKQLTSCIPRATPRVLCEARYAQHRSGSVSHVIIEFISNDICVMHSSTASSMRSQGSKLMPRSLKLPSKECTWDKRSESLSIASKRIWWAGGGGFEALQDLSQLNFGRV